MSIEKLGPSVFTRVFEAPKDQGQVNQVVPTPNGSNVYQLNSRELLEYYEMILNGKHIGPGGEINAPRHQERRMQKLRRTALK